MSQTMSYRERIARYVIEYQKSQDNKPVLSADIYRALFQKYPRFVNFRMVSHVLHNKAVFEEVSELSKERYGRVYRIIPSVFKLDVVEILRRFMGGIE